MKNYELNPDEAVLYKGDVTPVGEKGETQLILTNINIVFITERKRFLVKDEINVEVYPVGDIKIYKNIPQVKVVNDDIVEIYLITQEKEFKFPSTDEVQKFIHEVNELLIPKPFVSRCVEKVKGVLGEEGLRMIKVAGAAVAVGAGVALAAKAMPKEKIKQKPKAKHIVKPIACGIALISEMFKRRHKGTDKPNEDNGLQIVETSESTENEIPQIETIETESEE